MDVVKVGQNIAKIRRENNMTQEKDAEELKISVPAVSKWENGRSLPDITLLPELARIFDCTIDHILLTDKGIESDSHDSDQNIDLLENIIHMIEERCMIGVSNQSIVKAFRVKHGCFGGVSVIRKDTIRLERSIVNRIIVKANGRSYPLIEKVLFGDMQELYHTKLLNDFGISIPLIYKIDFEEKSLLMEDVSGAYISGRESDADTINGRIYRSAYNHIMRAAARFHMSFWKRVNILQQLGLPWCLRNKENYLIHNQGMRKEFYAFLEKFPNRLSKHDIECFEGALNYMEKVMPDMIQNRFSKARNITVIHGDLNPGNVFVAKDDITNVKFIDMEAVRVGLPTEDLAMFIALHMNQSPEVFHYLKQYYIELCKEVKDYSVSEFMEDYKCGVMMMMFHPIGIVGMQLNICDENMLRRAVDAYEFCQTDLSRLKDEIQEKKV